MAYKFIKCKDVSASRTTGAAPSITLNKEYEIINENNEQFFIKNDLGSTKGYLKTRFEYVINKIDKSKDLFEPKVFNMFKKPVANFNIPNKKDENMSNQNDMPSTFSTILNHVEHGAKVAAAAEASELVLDIAKPLLGDVSDVVLATDEGRQLTKLVVSSLLLHLCSMEGSFIPKKELVGGAAGLVVEATARDFLQPRMGAVRAALEKLANTAVTAGIAAVKEEKQVQVPVEVAMQVPVAAYR